MQPKLSELSNDQIKEYMEKNTLDIDGITVLEGELKPNKHFSEAWSNHNQWAGSTDKDFAVLINTEETKEIRLAYLAREYLSKIQKLRKDSGVEIDDDIEIFF